MTHKSSIRTVVTACMAGSAVEWYDFFLYGIASATVLNKLFFPNFDAGVGTILSFSTFFVGFIARPLGGLISGHFGDKMGRKSILVITMVAMGAGTFLMGCLPTYSSIGILAPIMLVFLRFVQGLAVGGEWGGASVMTIEHAPPDKRGLYGGLLAAGSSIGLLLANAVFLLSSKLTQDDFLVWGWRIPFLVSIVLVGIGYYIRRRLDETPAFTSAESRQATSRTPFITLLRTNPKVMLQAMGAKVGEAAQFNIFVVFGLSAIAIYQVERDTYLVGTMIAAAISLATVPFAGALSDRYGRKKIYCIGLIALIGLAFGFFPLVSVGADWAVYLAITLSFAGVGAATAGIQPTLFSEMFSTDVRYTGASVGYQWGGTIGGGTAPLVATALMQATGSAIWIAVYAAGLAIISLISVATTQETFRKDLNAAGAKTPRPSATLDTSKGTR
ncbi:MFS transporter [Streptosporangium sp. NPDC006007]|uniref:MFS transporter n=1 Tax=Streptosporangium sp. NPDC006007 TaxID=3154575 RepID=UPI0033AB28CA